MTNERDALDLIDELLGNQCRCGSKKKTRQTFCRACYFKLPGRVRASLYNRVGEGYEEAYANAVEFLDRQPEATE